MSNLMYKNTVKNNFKYKQKTFKLPLGGYASEALPL